MRYNDRIKIVTTQSVDGELGPVTKKIISDWIECRITGVSQTMNIGVFGKYNSNALAVHLKGGLGTISGLIYNGVERKPEVVIKARKNTIVVIQGV
ncbi:hypothetical protein KAR50_00425 [Periweissella fabaria]|uniref:Uncharacterized protein n=1 Tax=Periweissella fabaria TaxID=546157 RepID=A0ABM8Z3Z3_9LACO|nr:hypothetical protein [Periweissella fabaria]MCM0596326.1 hypothetical protein [Periweissella fabaria]CAH0415964.1 hypothetical protein WFA24289_00263 [Periweissella fabaria]